MWSIISKVSHVGKPFKSPTTIAEYGNKMQYSKCIFGWMFAVLKPNSVVVPQMLKRPLFLPKPSDWITASLWCGEWTSSDWITASSSGRAHLAMEKSLECPSLHKLFRESSSLRWSAYDFIGAKTGLQKRNPLLEEKLFCSLEPKALKSSIFGVTIATWAFLNWSPKRLLVRPNIWGCKKKKKNVYFS